MSRFDLSQWIIHFVHKRKPEDNLDGLKEIALLEGYEGEVRLPDFYDGNGEGVNLLTEYDEQEFEIEEDAESIDVLRKILHDGFIHSSWSLRNMNPTIYGPRGAVCFTEMPLYALSDYVKERGRTGYVGNICIAFKRSELFEAGARPVIYGLSGVHIEKDYFEGDIYQGRLLDDSCGIGINEQYRYVATSLTSDPNLKSIDWTHEREWRWPLPYGDLGIPGLPFLLEDFPYYFSEVLIIVDSEEDKKLILEYLKTLHDSEGNNMGFCYDKVRIDKLKVIALEDISKYGPSISRIEDIRSSFKSSYPQIHVTNETKTIVDKAIVEAEEYAKEQLNFFISENPDYNSGYSLAGFAWVCTDEISEITEAFILLGRAATFADGVYQLDLDLRNPYNDDINIAKLIANAAAERLTKALGQSFYVRSKLD